MKYQSIVKFNQPIWRKLRLKWYGYKTPGYEFEGFQENARVDQTRIKYQGTQREYQTMQIDGNRLFVVNGYDLNLMVHTGDRTVDPMPKQGLDRLGFTVIYKSGLQNIWVIGGDNVSEGFQVNTEQRFDIVNQKWKILKNTNYKLKYPGGLITKNNDYLYAICDEIIERLNISAPDEKQCWLYIQIGKDWSKNMRSLTIYNNERNKEAFYVVGGMGILTKIEIYPEGPRILDLCFEWRGKPTHPPMEHQSPFLNKDFKNSNPVIYQNDIICLSGEHIYVIDIQTDKIKTREDLGAGFFEGLYTTQYFKRCCPKKFAEVSEDLSFNKESLSETGSIRLYMKAFENQIKQRKKLEKTKKNGQIANKKLEPYDFTAMPDQDELDMFMKQFEERDKMDEDRKNQQNQNQ